MTTHVPINPVVKQIAELQNKSFAELKALWKELYGKPPPAYRRGFLTRALAYRIQELVYGGLPPAYQARLDALIDDRPDPARTKRPHSLGADRPVVGTRLIREWRGVEHVVTVNRKRTGQASAVIFLLVPQVSLRKRLDVGRTGDTWAARVPSLIARNWTLS
ncbi:DUF2924 domain-containing protein [uncultured Methylobacterium sp.]|uniref:DUF2924 domain-containing protein n=1 Tax=uncultured Methylobacterium sp. TaxID=157278 RepID=UPI0035C97B77